MYIGRWKFLGTEFGGVGPGGCVYWKKSWGGFTMATRFTNKGETGPAGPTCKPFAANPKGETENDHYHYQRNQNRRRHC